MRSFLYICLFVTCVLSAQSERKFSLYYANDAYELTDEHHALLDSLRSIVNKVDFDVHIKGYTNSIGREAYNLELSKKRATGVKNELRDFTIISTKGFGELKDANANNRRVDVLIHLKTDHVAQEGEIVEIPISEKKEYQSITLLEPKKGDKLVLQGIMFYPGRDIIRNESTQALEELLDFLKRNPKITFRLIGHVCCGDDENPGMDLRNTRTGKHNLSEARAQALHNYLARKGIDKKRMRYRGMAFRVPTGLGDAYDRRVEIEIISVD